MTSEFLLDAIGQMDDDLVTEAAEPVRREIPWLKVSGWAAALLLCAGVASLPNLLPMNGTGSTAAPESDFVLGDVILDQDGKAEDYEYRSDQESQVLEPSAANKTESASATADGAAHGLMEPKFFTQRGLYMLMGDEFPYKPKLPDTEHLNKLGALVTAVPGTKAYPSTGTEEYVGCPVWESADGKTLYIELPDGGCLFATLYE